MENFELYLQYHKEIAENKLKTINRFLKSSKPKTVKRMSKASTVENVLRIAERPLHISSIIEIVNGVKSKMGSSLWLTLAQN
jgi:hypothetical protein